MPLVRPELSEGTRASILIPTSASQGAQVGVEARVVSDDGELMATPSVEWHQPPLGGADGTRWIPGTLSTDGLPPGDYRLEVTASQGATSGRQIRSAEFTVRN